MSGSGDGAPLIALEYDLTERDVIQARFWFLRRNRVLVAFGLLGVIGGGVFVVWALVCGNDFWTVLPYMLLMAFWVGFLPASVVIGAKQFYRTLLDSERHNRMRFGSAHFEHEDGESSGRHSWRVVQLAAETPNAFYFVHRGSQLRVVPKRAFPSASEIDAFRTLLRGALGERAHLRKVP